MSVFTVTQGENATWTVDFIDPITGQRVTVTGGTLTLNYRQSKVPFILNIPLVPLDVRWQANWDSTAADLGYGTWAVTATGATVPSASGTLRVVTDP